MSLWTYLRGLRHWWWLPLFFGVGAFLVASFVLIPPAPWTVSWTTAIVFNGDPNAANNAQFLDSVLLDDMTQLLESDVLGDEVYLELPEEIASEYSRDDIGQMFDSRRHGRFVEFFVSADDPDVAVSVARTTRDVLPEAINTYLIPPDFTRIPAQIRVTTFPTGPEQQTTDRLIQVGGVTMAGVTIGFAGAGVAEWTRLSYREKYGAR